MFCIPDSWDWWCLNSITDMLAQGAYVELFGNLMLWASCSVRKRICIAWLSVPILVMPLFPTWIAKCDVPTGAALKLLGSASVESDKDCAGNGNCSNGWAVVFDETSMPAGSCNIGVLCDGWSATVRGRWACWGAEKRNGFGVELGQTERITSKYHCFCPSGGSPCTLIIWSPFFRERMDNGGALSRFVGICGGAIVWIWELDDGKAMSCAEGRAQSGMCAVSWLGTVNVFHDVKSLRWCSRSRLISELERRTTFCWVVESSVWGEWPRVGWFSCAKTLNGVCGRLVSGCRLDSGCVQRSECEWGADFGLSATGLRDRARLSLRCVGMAQMRDESNCCDRHEKGCNEQTMNLHGCCVKIK